MLLCALCFRQKRLWPEEHCLIRVCAWGGASFDFGELFAWICEVLEEELIGEWFDGVFVDDSTHLSPERYRLCFDLLHCRRAA